MNFDFDDEFSQEGPNPKNFEIMIFEFLLFE